RPSSTERSLRISAIRSTRLLYDWIVNSFSKSSSKVISRRASTPSLPCSAAISATVLPSYFFKCADLTSCSVMRAQLPNDAGRFGQVVAVEHVDEADRAAALLQHEAEQLHLRLLHHRDLARHRVLDRALAALAQRVAVGLDLLAAGVAAGERAAAVAHVLVEQRAREAERARIDRFSQ